jgi:hypothetical protein
MFNLVDNEIFREKTGISNTRTSKKKRGHRNGDIEKTGTSKTATSKLKSKKLKSKNYTSIPDRLL